ncbi:Os04g0384266 [Oryza sativa Japonica Group]|uniref:Os04g0384266 protein n=1 Tax=Oryza sativa subsp. japonica TaxID=39947 RepID=A0A0P0W9N5_ORYSJ|nr:Os04g0384266 [Oryza sativa Japonica Group]
MKVHPLAELGEDGIGDKLDREPTLLPELVSSGEEGIGGDLEMKPALLDEVREDKDDAIPSYPSSTIDVSPELPFVTTLLNDQVGEVALQILLKR